MDESSRARSLRAPPRSTLNINAANGEDHTAELSQLVDKNITHFEEYATQRASLAREDVFSYFSPTWCTSLEGSMLWAGGCRPSIFIRLVYSLSGNKIVSLLDEFLNGDRMGGLGELSPKDIADEPIAIIANELNVHGGPSRAADEAIDEHSISMTSVLEEADNLRLGTMKELINILTTVQAVDFLAAAKKLHLCLHAWGRRRDLENTRN
ncbi:hypothetical protein BUALT_Bualt03G0043800 [Buddleja alternifolia]|uniref:DOG1 domain-containing protein n=1 Tax=Buddleja alternifolia TaxID=168488 RepID=A0AAV6XT71_9LAMI|nr:hypothetical protein BUALT_Bualt03G0043800 [Buddleja alternifolia]